MTEHLIQQWENHWVRHDHIVRFGHSTNMGKGCVEMGPRSLEFKSPLDHEAYGVIFGSLAVFCQPSLTDRGVAKIKHRRGESYTSLSA